MIFDSEDAIYESSALHPLDEPVPPGFWRTRDGDVRIATMTDDHLRNALAWVRRSKLGVDPWTVDDLRREMCRREGRAHWYEVNPELYALALAWASGASAGKTDATVCVREQGGAQIPCIVVEWSGYQLEGVALPVADLLRHLGLPLPRRGL